MARRPPDRLIELGRVAGSYGVRGWIKVDTSGDSQVLLTRLQEWCIGGGVVAVEEAKAHGAAVLGKLAGIETREQALKLKGSRVAAPRSALPAPEAGRYYFEDLIGLEVVNRQGERLGAVRRLFNNGAHDVMELAGGRLLPWVGSVVLRVDREAGRVEVDWGADW